MFTSNMKKPEKKKKLFLWPWLDCWFLAAWLEYFRHLYWCGKTNKKHSLCRGSMGGTAVLMRRAQSRMARLLQADTKARVIQITTTQMSTTYHILSWIGYNSRRPNHVPLWSNKNRNLKLQCTQDYQNYCNEIWVEKHDMVVRSEP